MDWSGDIITDWHRAMIGQGEPYPDAFDTGENIDDNIQANIHDVEKIENIDDDKVDP